MSKEILGHLLKHKNEIKAKIREDVRRFPHEPHLWSQETRQVAFGNNNLKSSADLKAKFVRAKSKVTEDVVEDVGAHLREFTLNLDLGGEEEEEEGEEKRENNNVTDNTDISILPNVNDAEGAAISGLQFLTNPAFATFTKQASGFDYDLLVEKQRKAKSKQSRKGKIINQDGEVVDSITGEKSTINENAWIHYKDAPDECKTLRVSMFVGKMKRKLLLSTENKKKTLVAGVSAEASSAVAPAAKNQIKANSSSPSPFQPASTTIDWENQASSFFTETLEGTKEVTNRAERLQRFKNKEGIGTKSKVIMSIPWNDGGEENELNSYMLNIEQQEIKQRLTDEKLPPISPSVSPPPYLQQQQHQHQPPYDTADFNMDPLDSMSDFKNAASAVHDAQLYPVGTPIVDIGAADSLSDLIGWADNKTKRDVVEISLLKDSKNREIYDLIKQEEEDEISRQNELSEHTHPARRKRVKLKHEKERRRTKEIIIRMRQENEMIIANKLAKFGLIR